MKTPISIFNYPTHQNKGILATCLELILPTQCLICSRPLRYHQICYRCRPRLPDLCDRVKSLCPKCFSPMISQGAADSSCATCKLYPLPVNSMRYLWDYDGLARDLIRTMKYRPSLRIAEICGMLLKESINTLFADTRWDFIVPVPASQLMLRKRLFHPCTEIATPVAKSLRIRVERALISNSKRAPQASLSHEARITGVRRLFAINQNVEIEDKRILVIEDVITTGATISAAARTLKQHGAAQIDVLAVARTHVWPRFRRQLSESLAKY